MQPSKPVVDSIKECRVSTGCLHKNVVKDYSSGELVCVDCGVVLGYSEEASFVQMRSVSRLSYTTADGQNLFYDRYSMVENRMSMLEAFYDSFSKVCALPKSVYETALSFARNIFSMQWDNGFLYKLRTWEIAYPCLAKACELHGIAISRRDLGDLFVRAGYVEREAFKSGVRCFSRILKACDRPLPRVDGKHFVEKLMRSLRNRAFVRVLERNFAATDVSADVLLNEIESGAMAMVDRIRNVAHTTAAALAIAYTVDQVCKKYGAPKIDWQTISFFLNVPNLNAKRKKAVIV
ncbi:MAG: hypothetical protein QXJ62_06285 [Nitrososphaeria archaeon]